MKKLKSNSLLFVLIPIIFTTFTNAQWYDRSSGLPENNCFAWAIDAHDSLIAAGPFTRSTLYVIDSLYITTDGGNNWYAKPLPDTLEYSDDLMDISMIGQNNIWFCTKGETNGKIYNTTNGGLDWQLQFYDPSMSGYMKYIEMFDSLNGIAIGDAPAPDKPSLILKTTNGGTDWISQNDSSLIGLSSFDLWRSVDFVDINIGYFYRNNKIYKTINSGKDWETIYENASSCLLKAYDENILLVEEPNAGNFGTIHRTLDGGQNWESNQFDFLSWGSDIEYIPGNPSNVWYASNSVSFSSDTGKTWTEEFSQGNTYFRDIVFTDENFGWLLSNTISTGSNTRIFRTTNGGLGGIVVSADEISGDIMPNGFILEQNYPNPFNPATIINFSIPEMDYVSIKIYDVLGNEVETLVDEEKPAGNYEIEFTINNLQLTSGVYFYQIRVGSYIETKRMVLLK
jgi:photosystem II stability/assembly factor-like uncharacterized protein